VRGSAAILSTRTTNLNLCNDGKQAGDADCSAGGAVEMDGNVVGGPRENAESVRQGVFAEG